MTVSELIEVLKRQPQDYPVMLAYDSFVCIYPVERDRCFVVHSSDAEAVYLCAMGAGCVEYASEENHGSPLA